MLASVSDDIKRFILLLFCLRFCLVLKKHILMIKTNFKLCPRGHERKHETAKFSNSGLCCNKTMHVKTGVYIIVYFEALQLTAFCTYVFTKIFISCCGMDFLILLFINFLFIFITFILHDGAKSGDILKLKASVTFFIIRLFLFLLWSLMIAAVNIFDLDGFEYFREYLVTRLTFSTCSVVYSILAIIIVFKCHQYFLRLKIIATRGKATSLQLPCCNTTEITSSPYAINPNNCCQKHCQVLINKGALIQTSTISVRTESPESEIQ